MKSIVISGYYGSKNAGDEAMLAAMLEVLGDLEPNLHITVISAAPEDTATRHGVDSVSWLDFMGIFRALRSASLLISGGGSLLQNVTSRRSLYYYLGVIGLAELLGVPVMLYAQGIGPICGHLPRRVMRFIASRARLITVRDRGSLSELKSLGITRPKIECTADPVLAIHKVGREAGRSILKTYGVSAATPIVAFSVRDWQGEAGFKKVIASVSDRVTRELGARVVFLPMQYPEDVSAARDIMEQKSEDATVLEDEYTTSELLSLVGNMDLMVGIRLHALIFAGVMGVPMAGVSYDPKIDRFLSSIGEESAGTIEAVTEEALMQKIAEKWAERETFAKKNKSLMATLRERAARNAELAASLMKAR